MSNKYSQLLISYNVMGLWWQELLLHFLRTLDRIKMNKMGIPTSAVWCSCCKASKLNIALKYTATVSEQAKLVYSQDLIFYTIGFFRMLSLASQGIGFSLWVSATSILRLINVYQRKTEDSLYAWRNGMDEAQCDKLKWALDVAKIWVMSL